MAEISRVFSSFFSWQHKVIKLTFRLSLAAHLDKIRTQQRSVPCHRGRNIDCLSQHLALKDMDSLKYVAENSPLVCGILPRVKEAVYFLITTFDTACKSCVFFLMISWTFTIVILNEAVCAPFPCLAFNRLGNDAQIIFFFHNLFF